MTRSVHTKVGECRSLPSRQALRGKASAAVDPSDQLRLQPARSERAWVELGGLLIGAALVASALPAQAHASHAQSGPAPIRRIVTTEDAAGRAVVLADGHSANSVTLNGSTITRLWETQGSPVAVPVAADLGATAGNAYRPGFTGSSLYVADIPPGSNLKDIPLHKQESMDYIVLLTGQIDLVLATGPGGGKRVAMKPGDVLIQAGNNHSWVNTGKTVARLLCVTQTGVRPKP
ncbi:cupin domain-containing protein [Novosphingobium sp. Gsoil 351]|uniref:cupin domain-containing protein n=1 Tax=Novosphingobium sp. Gsoil 351 TaxID=2675225 RepID=UPI0018A80274|nr:cupin domain-containing protein [Novosphingobium sp. Gsoil 351]